MSCGLAVDLEMGTLGTHSRILGTPMVRDPDPEPSHSLFYPQVVPGPAAPFEAPYSRTMAHYLRLWYRVSLRMTV